MTNQSHTELAAQARRAVKLLEILDMDSTADLLRQCAALESPERVTKEMWKNAAENTLELAQSLATPPTAPAQDAQGSAAWENSEGWESLAWELCADENGEESCNELIWEGGPVPEPWGERWLKYEDEAKRLIALVHKHVPATPSPQAEKQPLSLDEIQAWAVRRKSALGPEGVTDPVAFLEEGVRWGEAQHGIVTKEST